MHGWAPFHNRGCGIKDAAFTEAGGTLPQPCVMPEAVRQVSAMACSIPRAGICPHLSLTGSCQHPLPQQGAQLSRSKARAAALCSERLWLSLENQQHPHAIAIMSKRPFVFGSGNRVLGEGAEPGAGPSLWYHSLLWAVGLSLWYLRCHLPPSQPESCCPHSHLPSQASPAVPVVSLPLLSSCPGCFNNIMYAKIIYLCIK